MVRGSNDRGEDLPEDDELEGTFAEGTFAEASSDGDDDLGATFPAATLGADDEEAPTIPATPASRAASKPARRPSSGAARAPLQPPGGAPADAALGSTFAGRFELVRSLGEGGMGRVYMARDIHLDQNVALKVLSAKFSSNEEFRKMFLREIKTAQKFVSPNVNQVRDTGVTDDGTLYFTMDLVDGEDLSRLMKREDLLNVRHALDITRQVLEGLKSGHENGFVHRDIKPANIMLASRVPKTDDNPYGVDVRLLDFGIAGLAAELEGGQLVGTPNYMSPEQVQRKPVDLRTDLFAVGIVLYEMIAGARLFDGRTIAQVTSSILETDVAPKIADLSNLSRPLQAILRRALQKDRDKRYQSAAEFIKAIETSKAYRLPKVMPAWASASLLLLLGGAGAAGYLAYDAQRGVAEAERVAQERRDDLARVRDELKSKEIEISRLQGELSSSAKAEDVERKAEEGLEENTIADLERDLESERRSLQAKQSELELAQQQVSTLETDVRSKDSTIGELRQRINELTNQLTRAERLDTPVYQIAKRFDEALLAYWGLRNARKAETVLADLYDRYPGELYGYEYMVLVTDLVRRLADPASGGASLESLVSGVRAGFDGFGIDATWLAEGETAEQAKETERYARFRELVLGPNGLVAQAERVSEEMVAVSQSQRSELALAPALDGPEQVLAFAAVNPGPDADALVAQRLGAFANALVSEAAVGGVLNPSRLAQVRALRAWALVLTDEQHAGLARTPDGVAVQRLMHASRWYSESSYTGQGVDASLFADPGAEPSWWTPLRLAHELLQPGSDFPAPGNGQLVYRRSLGPRTFWVRVRMPSAPESTATGMRWSLDSRVFDAAGQVMQDDTSRVERNGKVFTELGSNQVLLALAGGEPLRVVEWRPAQGDVPPAKVVRGAEAFLEEARRNPIPCLVLSDGDTRRWVSPRYGLVREEIGSAVRELVHTTR